MKAFIVPKNSLGGNMDLISIIERHNNGVEYSKEELEIFALGYAENKIDDITMTKFIKSIYDNELSIPRASDLTNIMMNSGDIIDLSDIDGIKVDKHSTGGVGDKVTLIVAPIVAALGGVVAKMSGRGLGFTGGTLDKLESIPGYKINLSTQEFKDTIIKHQIAVVGQTSNLVPADKKMYALRDETGLIGSFTLIASSIMSKKLATGSDAILLDVKCGDAAFMKNQKDAEKLANLMIDMGKHMGRDVKAEITSMNTPLGKAIGNKNEVLESIKFLSGEFISQDLEDVILSSASTMLVQGKVFNDIEKAKVAIKDSLKNGKALEKFKEWITAQHGNFEDIIKNDFWNPINSTDIIADKDGFMNITSAVTFGIVAMKIGAGREKKEDSIDYEAGIQINKKSGEAVKKGDILFTLHSSSEIKTDHIDEIKTAYEINEKAINKKVILNKL